MLVEHWFLITKKSQNRIYSTNATSFRFQEARAFLNIIDLFEKLIIVSFWLSVLHFHDTGLFFQEIVEQLLNLFCNWEVHLLHLLLIIKILVFLILHDSFCICKRLLYWLGHTEYHFSIPTCLIYFLSVLSIQLPLDTLKCAAIWILRVNLITLDSISIHGDVKLLLICIMEAGLPRLRRIMKMFANLFHGFIGKEMAIDRSICMHWPCHGQIGLCLINSLHYLLISLRLCHLLILLIYWVCQIVDSAQSFCLMDCIITVLDVRTVSHFQLSDLLLVDTLATFCFHLIISRHAFSWFVIFAFRGHVLWLLIIILPPWKNTVIRIVQFDSSHLTRHHSSLTRIRPLTVLWQVMALQSRLKVLILCRLIAIVRTESVIVLHHLQIVIDWALLLVHISLILLFYIRKT